MGSDSNQYGLIVCCHSLLIVFIFLFRLSLRYFVCMVDCPLLSKPLTTYGILIVSKKSLMKGLCVICYGLTQMTDVVGVFHLVVLDIHLARCFSYIHASILEGAVFNSSLSFSLLSSFNLIFAFLLAGYFWTIQSHQQLKVDCQSSSVSYGWI